MSKRNWDKVRRENRVWKHGADPIWNDDQLYISRRTRALKREIGVARSQKTKTPTKPLCFDIMLPTQKIPVLSIEFLELHPGHRQILTRLADRLIREEPRTFLNRFSEYLDPDYFMKISSIQSVEGSNGYTFEVTPRKKRKPRPKSLEL